MNGVGLLTPEELSCCEGVVAGILADDGVAVEIGVGDLSVHVQPDCEADCADDCAFFFLRCAGGKEARSLALGFRNLY